MRDLVASRTSLRVLFTRPMNRGLMIASFDRCTLVVFAQSSLLVSEPHTQFMVNQQRFEFTLETA
jgi:hypothetical protein